jgi:Fic family protein
MISPVKYHYGAFPPHELEWLKLIPLIGPASAALARYDGTLSAVPNAAVLLTPITTQEAVLSSRIEGTQATMGEVLEYEAEVAPKNLPPEKTADINEVLNYRKAIWQAVDLLRDLPLCQRVVKEAHRILMDGVRGRNKAPGEYRRIPNWIGPPGCSIEEARFIPISPDKLNDGMGAWERYIHAEVPDRLIQLAILHAEFEALHPFLDGNGRLGRMFIPLFLFKMGLLSNPIFYISAYFERNKDDYYDRLLAVSQNRAWTEWCVFFLKAIQHQSLENQQKADAILRLYEDKKRHITKLAHSQYAMHTIDFLFRRPIFRSSEFVSQAGIPEPTAKRLLKVLREDGFLKVLHEASGRRSALLIFWELLNAAEGYEAF